jgi:hypothetical protein
MKSETTFVVLVLVLFALVGNVTNATSTDCPENYYGGDDTGLYDLLDRGWCHNYTGLLQHLLP